MVARLPNCTDYEEHRHMHRKSSPLALLLTLSATSILLNPGAARADDLAGKGDRFLSEQAAARPKCGWTHVIVRFAGNLTPAQGARLKALGADITRRLPIIDSAAVSVPARNLQRLAALPFVVRLSLDIAVQKTDAFSVGSSLAGTAYAQYGLTGKGVGVAVIDSGIVSHSDLSDSSVSRVVANVNFVPNEASAADTCGHGTHVAGILAGNGRRSTGENFKQTFYGVARKANLVNLRVLNSKGQGAVSSVVAAVQWAVGHKAAYNIRVMNLSIGHQVGESYTTDPLYQALESAWKAGIVVVVAAGNGGRVQNTTNSTLSNEGFGINYGSIASPGNDPYVITVGATKNIDSCRAHDRIATYSSRGPSRLDLVLKPDIIAPGNKIVSLTGYQGFLQNSYSSSNIVPWYVYCYNEDSTAYSTDYFVLSGTSMATPVVSGAAAMLLEKYPSLSPDTVKARLMLSADKWAQPDGTMDPCTFGAGYLNIVAALNSSAVPNQPATSPSMSVDADGNVYINMDRAIWGKDINGTRAVWGVNGVSDLRAVWGTRAIWGSSANILNASRAVWGTSVWSDRAVWGTSGTAADLSSNAVNGETGGGGASRPSDQ